ncbi:MAG: rhodanese-like domain-containing protein [Bulleidia sp.]
MTFRKTALTAICALLCTGCAAESSGWKTIRSDEAEQLMKTEKNAVILDVRTESEYAAGHIPHAINISYDLISSENTADFDHDQMILVYCRSGNRSAKAARTLTELGFTNVYDFGGITSWTGDVVQ